MTLVRSLRDGWIDIAAALGRHWLWRALARQDLRRRFHRTLIGPIWNALSLALAAGALSFVFASPLGGASPAYPVFVAIGLALWQFVLATLGEAPAAFVAAADSIRATPLPSSLFVLRLVWRNLAVLAVQAPVIIAAILLCGVRLTPSIFLLPAALLLWGIAAAGATLLLATIGARFRDTQPVVNSGLQLLFFLSPIFWSPSMLPAGRAWLVHLNPLTAFVEIVRAPLLGTSATALSWSIAAALSALLTVGGVLVFGHWRARIAYWA